jgi:hypothetical protein
MLSLDFRTWQDSSLNLATNDNSRGQPLQLVLDSEINSNAILLTNIMAYFRGGYGKGGCSQKCAENMRGLKFGRRLIKVTQTCDTTNSVGEGQFVYRLYGCFPMKIYP